MRRPTNSPTVGESVMSILPTPHWREREVALRSVITLVVILSNCQLIEINNDCQLQLPSHPISPLLPPLTWSLPAPALTDADNKRLFTRLRLDRQRQWLRCVIDAEIEHISHNDFNGMKIEGVCHCQWREVRERPLSLISYSGCSLFMFTEILIWKV